MSNNNNHKDPYSDLASVIKIQSVLSVRHWIQQQGACPVHGMPKSNQSILKICI